MPTCDDGYFDEHGHMQHDNRVEGPAATPATTWDLLLIHPFTHARTRTHIRVNAFTQITHAHTHTCARWLCFAQGGEWDGERGAGGRDEPLGNVSRASSSRRTSVSGGVHDSARVVIDADKGV